MFWAVLLLILAMGLVLLGRYRGVELASTGMALVISITLVFAAALVFPGPGVLAGGLVPSLPGAAALQELMPWLGFMMSGAAGLIWYSYWLIARGYGAAPVAGKVDKLSAVERSRLDGWMWLMTTSTVVASLLLLVLMIALVILGSEVLGPRGLVPAGPQVTSVLSQLLGGCVRPTRGRRARARGVPRVLEHHDNGYDGWGRLHGEGTTFIAQRLGVEDTPRARKLYRYAYVVGLMGVLPVLFFTVLPRPVVFLILAGTVEAIHIPVVAFAVLYLNRGLPEDLRPSWSTTGLTLAASLFFLFFAMYYVYTQF